MESQSESIEGQRIGPYTLIEKLGAGASATVYLARDEEERSWAVKVRRRGIRSMDRRFLREFETMRLLRVPGVVRVHEAGIEDELLWFSMDLVWGREFLEVIHEEKFISERVARVIELGTKLFEILTRLHNSGFVHRDVKPSNVLVDKGGQVQVLDFGIGMYFSDHADTTLSRTGEILGTIPYMAPEQIANLPFDHRIDLFAAGLMMHEAIVGTRPRPSTPVAWIPRICMDRLEPLACTHKAVPLGLSTLVEQLTSVLPDERPSAQEAANRLSELSAGMEHHEWPEVPFVDSGTWWMPLEGCLGFSEKPVWILEGDSGSGRGRVAEQIHRQGLLQGIWPIHIRCRIEEVGGPLAQLCLTLLTGGDESWGTRIAGKQGQTLQRMWPHLPLPGRIEPGDIPTAAEVARAVTAVVGRASKIRHIFIVVHDLEQVDPLTLQALPRIARIASDSLGVLLLHEARWRTKNSKKLVSFLQARANAGFLRAPPLSAFVATRLAASVCPKASAPELGPCAPFHAMQAGRETLATWRDQPWSNADRALWPLAVRSPLPPQVYEGTVDQQPNPWVRLGDAGYELNGRTAHQMALARLSNRSQAARDLVGVYAAQLGDSADPGDMATLQLLAGNLKGAWIPAGRAAHHAQRVGRFSDARKWLLVLDTLPAQASQDFDLALVRAQVALQTEPGLPRMELVDLCEQLAQDRKQEDSARILRAEFQLRNGEPRAALVSALRVASPAMEPHPEIALRALQVAIQCRLALHQFADAMRELRRAEELLEQSHDRILPIQLGNIRAELAFARHDLIACRKHCQQLIRQAAEAGYVRGVAFAASRLGRVLRMLGRRREAEHQTRSARDAFEANGDVALCTEAGLALATLVCERGDIVGARHMLDETIRSIRGLNMEHLLPGAMRVALQVATLRGDPADAALALSTIEHSSAHDAEGPATLVRWWRTRGDIDRALAVEGPAGQCYGHTLWLLERARAALVGGDETLTLELARLALREAIQLAYSELQIYARLLLGVLQPGDAKTWASTVRKASASQYTEIFLGAIEMSARRLARQSDDTGARMKWRALRARSEELGYRPGEEEAAGWL